MPETTEYGEKLHHALHALEGVAGVLREHGASPATQLYGGTYLAFLRLRFTPEQAAEAVNRIFAVVDIDGNQSYKTIRDMIDLAIARTGQST